MTWQWKALVGCGHNAYSYWVIICFLNTVLTWICRHLCTVPVPVRRLREILHALFRPGVLKRPTTCEHCQQQTASISVHIHHDSVELPYYALPWARLGLRLGDCSRSGQASSELLSENANRERTAWKRFGTRSQAAQRIARPTAERRLHYTLGLLCRKCYSGCSQEGHNMCASPEKIPQWVWIHVVKLDNRKSSCQAGGTTISSTTKGRTGATSAAIRHTAAAIRTESLKWWLPTIRSTVFLGEFRITFRRSVLRNSHEHTDCETRELFDRLVIFFSAGWVAFYETHELFFLNQRIKYILR